MKIKWVNLMKNKKWYFANKKYLIEYKSMRSRIRRSTRRRSTRRRSTRRRSIKGSSKGRFIRWKSERAKKKKVEAEEEAEASASELVEALKKVGVHVTMDRLDQILVDWWTNATKREKELYVNDKRMRAAEAAKATAAEAVRHAGLVPPPRAASRSPPSPTYIPRH